LWGCETLGRHRALLNNLFQPYTRPSPVFWDKLYPSCLHRYPHFVDATYTRVLAGFKSINRVTSNPRRTGEVKGCPTKRYPSHTTLNWRHEVKLSPISIDPK
jgi:hypothetical protein